MMSRFRTKVPARPWFSLEVLRFLRSQATIRQIPFPPCRPSARPMQWEATAGQGGGVTMQNAAFGAFLKVDSNNVRSAHCATTGGVAGITNCTHILFGKFTLGRDDVSSRSGESNSIRSIRTGTRITVRTCSQRGRMNTNKRRTGIQESQLGT
ncbi:hypothetical protein BD779DRAFT_1550898 [Infundibulicybe gibba]|nr:hypothetical protein BD779DRAFT_1550898 [Infundibulicybe gibba]